MTQDKKRICPNGHAGGDCSCWNEYAAKASSNAPNQDTGWKEELGKLVYNWRPLKKDSMDAAFKLIESLLTQARTEERKKVIAEIRAAVKNMIYLKGYQENERQMKFREVGFEKAKRQFMRILSLSPVEESQPKNET